MSSVQDLAKCENCGGVKMVISYYSIGEEVGHCQRCGFTFSSLLERNADESLKLDENGLRKFIQEQSQGYGVFGIFTVNGGGHVGVFSEPLTEEMIATYRQLFSEEQIDQERSYVAKWEDGKQTLLLGSNLPDENFMDFDALMKKRSEKTDESETLSIKGLQHLTKPELLDILKEYLDSKLNFVEDDFKITQISLVGSRIKGTNREDSDLDIAFQYEGRYREDSLCDTLNCEPLMIDDMQVDFIPYSSFKGNYIGNVAPIEHLNSEVLPGM